MKLKQTDFETIQSKIYDYCGINLHEGKQALVRSRLMKRIRKLELRGFSHYIEFLERDTSGEEFLALVDVLTTNKTSFFRESQHFDFIVENVLPKINGRQVKWWSAGCSSGEEPVSCSIVLQEQNINARAVKILGTDISRDVIRKAKRGIYPANRIKNISPSIVKKYFNSGANGQCQIKKKVRKMITYGRLNLKKKWPLNGPFQVIMCRNVMIYFNRKTQKELVSRFWEILEPGGYLFLGHSESIASADRNFENISPAVYRKK
ncbi:CheR family methyltransferase [Fodinibius salsisoli]|uniref:protein-glutamate O-methyltransferase n=1 Tax=Fodinibius salsisoli TaxID=2820877 RepID=A0ABT3PHJ3_9BACT|nr:protein-glutamate O-methyltransferase [Fodinibius salsisoli]MCW9705393.1 protein-glutamate O-methyltransferase [Fodinibius salsisoli]